MPHPKMLLPAATDDDTGVIDYSAGVPDYLDLCALSSAPVTVILAHHVYHALDLQSVQVPVTQQTGAHRAV